jgi:hypothetical protein
MGAGKSSLRIHSIRTAIAATLSLAVARVFGLPEACWAAIATLVVMQSTLGATLLLSIERVAVRRWVLWLARSWPCGRSINLNPQDKTPNNLRLVLPCALGSHELAFEICFSPPGQRAGRLSRVK